MSDRPFISTGTSANNLASMTDEELAVMAMKSDSLAFQTLIHRYTDYIYNFIWQYVRTKEDAEDVTQDSFIKAWKHIKTFKKEKKFKTWMFTIARNTALDHIKKKKAISFSALDNFISGSNDSGDEMSFAETLSDPEPLPAEIFSNRELSKKLYQAMDQIDPNHRSVLILHYQDEMTFEEIADIMKKPMNTVKSWHHRALAKIRQELLHQNEPYNRKQDNE